jgi:hypothetical protein
MAMSATRRRSPRGRVSLELSPAQVGEVLRAAQGVGSLSFALAGLADVREGRTAARAHLQNRALSRSLIAGILVLACFPTDDGDLGNAEIATMLDMNLSTSHRYISTLLTLGLLERDPSTRRYRLAR